MKDVRQAHVDAAARLIAPAAPIPADYLTLLAHRAIRSNERTAYVRRTSNTFVYRYEARYVDKSRDAIVFDEGRWLVKVKRVGRGWLIADFNDAEERSSTVPRSWCSPTATRRERFLCRRDTPPLTIQ